MTTREAFEEWAIEAGYSVERIAYDPDNFLSGQYKSILTNTRWDAWQAATDAALSAPATAPEPLVPLTMEWEPGYPEAVAFGTQRQMDRLKKWLDKFFAMRLAVATAPAQPAWHDAPTCAGLWLCDEGDENPYRFTCHNVSIPLNPHLVGEGERWYGPIPKDKP